MTVSSRSIAPRTWHKCKTVLLPGALAALALVSLAPVAHAQVVFNNGGPDNLFIYFSDAQSGFFVAETFNFGATTTFNTVQWWGAYYPNNLPATTDDFTISFYNTTAGTPNVTPFVTFTQGNNVNRVLEGTNTPNGDGLSRFRYTATLSSPLTLTAGIYGLGIVNNTPDTPDYWGWSTASQTGTHYFRQSPTATYTATTSELAFNLQNNAVAPVPEPGAVATGGILGATILTGMMRGRLRKGKRTLSA